MGLLERLSSTLMISVKICNNFLRNYGLLEMAAAWMGEQKLEPLLCWMRLNFLRWFRRGMFPIRRSWWSCEKLLKFRLGVARICRRSSSEAGKLPLLMTLARLLRISCLSWESQLNNFSRTYSVSGCSLGKFSMMRSTVIYFHQTCSFLKQSCSKTVFPSFPVLDRCSFLVLVSYRRLSIMCSTFQGGVW